MEKGCSHGDNVDAPVFVSLGMVVLDELRFDDGKTFHDVPGGSGIYSTLGARLFRAGHHSKEIGCLVLAGYDFPLSVRGLLERWGMDLHIISMPERPATRGLLTYEDSEFGRKTFAYVAPPLQPQPNDLSSTELIRAKSFHILAPPDQLELYVPALLSLRSSRGIAEKPLIIWEPAPLACEQEHLDSHLRACRLVDVFSPNHLELTSLIMGKEFQNLSLNKELVESCAWQFFDVMAPKGMVVTRCGEHGCLSLTAHGLRGEWIKPFYGQGSPKVVDATGAGNAFLGGFSIGFQEHGDWREAAIYGSVAASFAVEQFGPPTFSSSQECNKAERWNGTAVLERLREYRAKILAPAD